MFTLLVNSRLNQHKATGISVYIRELYGALLPLTTEKEKVTFFQPPHQPELGVTKTAALWPGPLGAPVFDMFQTGFQVAAEQATIVHGTSYVLPTLVNPHVRLAVSVHDLHFVREPEAYPRHFQEYFSRTTAHSVKRADVIFAISEHTKRDIVEIYHIPEERVVVTPLAAARQYQEQVAQPRSVSEPYLFSAVTHPTRKNIARTIEAIAQVPAAKDLLYVLTGTIDDAQRRELTEVAAKVGMEKRLRFLGFVSDEQLLGLYQHAEAFLYPSLYEGFGIPILEASLSSCPVVTSSTSSMPELIVDSSRLADPLKVESIAGAIAYSLGQTGGVRTASLKEQKEFAAGYTWEVAAKTTLAAFRRLSTSS